MTDETVKPDIDLHADGTATANTERGEQILGVRAPAGWQAPLAQAYPLDVPGVTARRGGIQFGDGLEQLTQEQLITRVRALTGHLKRAEKRARKAERKNRRLLALVDKLV